MNYILEILELLFTLLPFAFTRVISVGTVKTLPGPSSKSNVTKSSIIFSSYWVVAMNFSEQTEISEF